MTLFDVKPAAVKRQAAPLAGTERPRWSKYTAQKRHRCDECVQVSFEAFPGPHVGISLAYFQRRQDAATRLYCYQHAAVQRAEDSTAWSHDAHATAQRDEDKQKWSTP